MAPKEDATALAQRLKLEARATLGSLLQPGEPVAVIDYPYSDNFGDAAIWLGQNVLLAELGHTRRYNCDVGRYKPEDLQQAHPAGPILLHGGGNFGDYWPEHQELRERVLKDFPDRQIVQLPQTVGFQERSGMDSVAAAMGTHPRFTLLARDQRSLALGRELGLTTQLCPDSATHLGALRRIGPRKLDLVILARTDHESGELRRAALERVDFAPCVEEWSFNRTERVAWTLAKTGPRAFRRIPSGTAARVAAAAPLRLSYDLMAKSCLHAAVRQLSRTRVLVTDRLHAHVIATLLGIPNIVVDNSYGKVRSIYEAFTHTSSTTYMAESPEDAFAKAEELLKS